MSDLSEHPLVAPMTIANALESVYAMVKDEIEDDDVRRTVGRILSTSANNVKMLFEFKADENGKFKPKNMGEIYYLVDLLMRANMAPSAYKNDPAIIAIGVMKAVEIDVDPIGGIANIMILKNRPSVWGDLAQALIQRSGKLKSQTKEKIGAWPDESDGLVELASWPMNCGWRVSTHRVDQDEPHVAEYTVADAKRAGLWMNTRKQPWISDPAEMLFNRARSRSQRQGFADGLYGFAIAEEMNDFADPVRALPNHTPSTGEDDDEPVTALDAPSEIQPMADFGSHEPLEKVETQQKESSPDKAPADETPETDQGEDK